MQLISGTSFLLAVPCVLAVLLRTTSAGHFEGSVVLANPTFEPVPDTGAQDGGYVNTEKLVQQSAKQIEEAIERSERRPETRTPSTQPESTVAARDSQTRVAAVASTKAQTPSLNAAGVQASTEATKPVKDKVSLYVKKASAGTFADKKKTPSSAKAETAKGGKASVGVNDGVRAVPAEVSRPASPAPVEKADEVTDSNADGVTTSTTVATSSSTTSASRPEAPPTEEDGEVGAECASKLRLPPGFKLWRPKDKHKLNLTLATDNVSIRRRTE